LAYLNLSVLQQSLGLLCFYTDESLL
jgi:hypothetical protein